MEMRGESVRGETGENRRDRSPGFEISKSIPLAKGLSTSWRSLEKITGKGFGRMIRWWLVGYQVEDGRGFSLFFGGVGMTLGFYGRSHEASLQV